ncbi:MAG: hypothetical protein M3O30_08000 [Planctomycetota bacterium]|nr:hypothetical protein [Planctomycetota bacterium]
MSGLKCGCAVLILAQVCLLAGAMGAENDPVSIVHSASVATTNRYDPHHPPSLMPTTAPDEAGVTVSEFGCDAQVGGTVFDYSRNHQDTVAVVRVDSVRMTLHLNIAEWISQNAGSKILLHENGHRMIAEHFYANADLPAFLIGRAKIGQRFVGEGLDLDAAAKNALTIAATTVAQEYMAAVRDPSQPVQEKYDQITAHGTNGVDELEAIDLSLRVVAGDQQVVENAGKRPRN